MVIEQAPFVRDGYGQWPLPLASTVGPEPVFYVGPANCMWFELGSNVFPGPTQTQCAAQGAPFVIDVGIGSTTALLNLTFTQTADPNGWIIDDYETLVVLSFGDASITLHGRNASPGATHHIVTMQLFNNDPSFAPTSTANGQFPESFFGDGPTAITLIISATATGWEASCPEGGIFLSVPFVPPEDANTSLGAGSFGGFFGWSDTGNTASVTMNVASVSGVLLPWCQDTIGIDPNTNFLIASGDFAITQVPITALVLYPYSVFPPPGISDFGTIIWQLPGTLAPAAIIQSQFIDISGMSSTNFVVEGIVIVPDIPLLVYSAEMYTVYLGLVEADFIELGYGHQIWQIWRSGPQYAATADHIYTTYDVDGRSLQIGFTPGLPGGGNFIQLCSLTECVLARVPALAQGVPFKFSMQVTIGEQIRAKVWQLGSPEPSCWLATVPDIGPPGPPSTFTVTIDAQHEVMDTQPIILFDDFSITDTFDQGGALDFGWGCETPLYTGEGRIFTTTRAFGNGTLSVYVDGKRISEGADWWAVWDGSGVNLKFEIADNIAMDLITNGCGEQVPSNLNVCYLPTRDLTNTRFQSPKNLKLNVDANKIQMFDIRGFN